MEFYLLKNYTRCYIKCLKRIKQPFQSFVKWLTPFAKLKQKRKLENGRVAPELTNP